VQAINRDQAAAWAAGVRLGPCAVCGRSLPRCHGRQTVTRDRCAQRRGAPPRAGRERSGQHSVWAAAQNGDTPTSVSSGGALPAGWPAELKPPLARNLAAQLLWDRRLAGGVEPRRAAAIATFTEALDACLEPR
jgi:hypothetical protein